MEEWENKTGGSPEPGTVTLPVSMLFILKQTIKAFLLNLGYP